MFRTFFDAMRIKEIRQKLLYTFVMLIIVRLGSNLPIPGINTDYFREMFDSLRESAAGGALSFFSAMTGGSFEQMSILALSISPYITSSIIIELMTIAIPRLEELQKEGEEGRKKMTVYTRYLTVALALIESAAMAIGFGSQGLLKYYGVKNIVVTIAVMTAGSAFLMWIGEKITNKGVGNGISVVLLINIVSAVPNDLVTLWTRFASGQPIAQKIIAVAIIAICIILMFAYVVLLTSAKRKIPVQYSGKVSGKKYGGADSSSIPLKVNTAGVIPVIFASSIMSFPVVIAQFVVGTYGTVEGVPGTILSILNSSNWFNASNPVASVGVLIYVVLIVLFAYFYTSITFNPLEIANNLKKSGGFIPGIRPGRPTSDYLQKVLNYIIFIGAIGLIVVAMVPLIVSGVFSISSLSFAGTSLIIIVGVIIETMKSIESQMMVRNYKGFLSE